MGFNELLFGVGRPAVPSTPVVSSDCDYDGRTKFETSIVSAGIRFDSPTRVFLEGMGPILVVSDKTTAGGTTIRWRLRSSGTNRSMFFGVVPTSDPTNPKHLDSPGSPSIMTASTSSSYVTRKFDFQNSMLEVVTDGKVVRFILHKDSGDPPMEIYVLPLSLSEPCRLAVTLYHKGGIDIV